MHKYTGYEIESVLPIHTLQIHLRNSVTVYEPAKSSNTNISKHFQHESENKSLIDFQITVSYFRAMICTVPKTKFEDLISHIHRSCEVYTNEDLNKQYIWNIIVSKCYQIFCNHDNFLSKKVYEEYFDFLLLHDNDHYILNNLTEPGMRSIRRFFNGEAVKPPELNPEAILLIKELRKMFNQKIMYYIDQFFVAIAYDSHGYYFASEWSVAKILLQREVISSIWNTSRKLVLRKESIMMAIEYSNQLPMYFWGGNPFTGLEEAKLWLKISSYAAAFHLAQNENLECDNDQWRERVCKTLKLWQWLTESDENLLFLQSFLPCNDKKSSVYNTTF